MTTLPEPSAHSYLGNSLEDVRQRVYYEGNEKLSIPVIFLENIVLFPTETLPLRVYDANFASFLQTYQQNRSLESTVPILIGIIGKFRRRTRSGRMSLRWQSSAVGTLAEAIATKFDGEETVIKAKGRYRFRLLPAEDTRSSIGNEQPQYQQRTVGGVRLHDVELLEGEEAYNPSSHCVCPTACSLRPVSSLSTLASSALYNSGPLWDKDFVHEEEYYARGMNHFPFWIYRKYNLKTLRREIVYAQYMLQGKPGDEESLRDLNSNDCPIQFSYRIAAQMIVADDERQTLLEASHENRLRTILSHYTSKIKEEQDCVKLASGSEGLVNLRSEDSDHSLIENESDHLDDEGSEHGWSSDDLLPTRTIPTVSSTSRSISAECTTNNNSLLSSNVRVLCCEACGSALAKEEDVFKVPGAEGSIGAYVNPHGVVHQTLTIKQILNQDVIHLTGAPSAEDSWFPGYSWTIAYCASCYSHLGWRFTLNSNIECENTSDSTSINECNNDIHSDDGCDDDDMADDNSVMSETGVDMVHHNSQAENEDDTNNNGAYLMSTADSRSISSDTNNNACVQNVITEDSICRNFWGIRRSAVKSSLLRREEIGNGDRQSEQNFSQDDAHINADVERLLQIYSDRLGVVLPPSQQAALRSQFRLLLQQQHDNDFGEI